MDKKQLPKLIFGGAALLLALWLGWRWWWNQSHVSTDDAQIEGSIIPVLPKVGGFIAEVVVRDNQSVIAGDLLVRIDERDYRKKLAQAEADLAVAVANAGGDKQGLASAQKAAALASAAAARSTVEQALANADKAQQDLERTRSLIERKMVSPQALDTAEAAARAALAQLAASRQSAQSASEQVSASGAALSAAQARVEAARAARDLAAIQLADTRVVAPASGMIGAKNVQPGQLVQAGQPLMSVVPLSDVWVVANLKETELAGVRPGQRSEIEVDSFPGLTFTGTVDSIAPATGARFSLLPPDNATGNFTKVVQRVPVKILVKQSTDPTKLLRPGMSVVATINLKS